MQPLPDTTKRAVGCRCDASGVAVALAKLLISKEIVAERG
jgi:hypothetical protein